MQSEQLTVGKLIELLKKWPSHTQVMIEGDNSCEKAENITIYDENFSKLLITRIKKNDNAK